AISVIKNQDCRFLLLTSFILSTALIHLLVLCKILCAMTLTKSQISRSERRFVYSSKKLNKDFIFAFTVTDCKTTNQVRAGDELKTLSMFLNVSDLNSKFERYSRLSGLRVWGTTGERQAQKSPTGVN
ncbi:hypothetical protein ACFDW3_004893, partial [Salmonella enterica]